MPPAANGFSVGGDLGDICSTDTSDRVIPPSSKVPATTTSSTSLRVCVTCACFINRCSGGEFRSYYNIIYNWPRPFRDTSLETHCCCTADTLTALSVHKYYFLTSGERNLFFFFENIYPTTTTTTFARDTLFTHIPIICIQYYTRSIKRAT